MIHLIIIGIIIGTAIDISYKISPIFLTLMITSQNLPFYCFTINENNHNLSMKSNFYFMKKNKTKFHPFSKHLVFYSTPFHGALSYPVF